MLTKKRIRRNSKRSKKFLLVGGNTDTEIETLLQERQLIFDEEGIGNTTIIKPITSPISKSGIQSLLLEEIDMNNSAISFIPCHGTYKKESYEVLPANTILCFLGVLGELTSDRTKNGKKHDIINIMRNINPKVYNDLLTQRTNFNKDIKEIWEFEYYDSFRNSTWYYPGDKYPDTSLEILRNDNDDNYDFIPIEITCKNEKIYVDMCAADFFDKGTNEGLIPGYVLDKTLSVDLPVAKMLSECIENINSKRPLINFRLIILTACRDFQKLEFEKQKGLLENEMYYFHKNSQIKQPIHKSPIHNSPIQDRISYLNTINYKDSQIYKYDPTNYYKLNLQGKIHWYNGKTPSLMRDNDDYHYLATFSISKIIRFFKDNKKNLGSFITKQIKLGNTNLENKINKLCLIIQRCPDQYNINHMQGIKAELKSIRKNINTSWFSKKILPNVSKVNTYKLYKSLKTLDMTDTMDEEITINSSNYNTFFNRPEIFKLHTITFQEPFNFNCINFKLFENLINLTIEKVNENLYITENERVYYEHIEITGVKENKKEIAIQLPHYIYYNFITLNNIHLRPIEKNEINIKSLTMRDCEISDRFDLSIFINVVKLTIINLKFTVNQWNQLFKTNNNIIELRLEHFTVIDATEELTMELEFINDIYIQSNKPIKINKEKFCNSVSFLETSFFENCGELDDFEEISI